MLVHLGTDRIHSLNRTGARLWELIGHEPRRSELMDQLLQEFSVSEDELEAEIDRILQELRTAELVVTEEGR